jgi:hypothetical protein
MNDWQPTTNSSRWRYQRWCGSPPSRSSSTAGHHRASAHALSQSAAAVLRLLDRALAAHAQAIGYATDTWLARTFECAHTRARLASSMAPEELPLGLLVDTAAEATADAVMALHRDPFDVPEALVDGLASLLVVYAAGTAMRS